MSNTSKQNNTPLYEKPGRLDPGRKVPNLKDSELTIHTHYRDGDAIPNFDPAHTEFTDVSANALEPLEDEALLRGEKQPKSTGVKTGAQVYVSKQFEPEFAGSLKDIKADLDKSGHKIIRNSDPMAGGASPAHARSSFKPEHPDFFRDTKKLALYSCGLIFVIAAEVAVLYWLFR